MKAAGTSCLKITGPIQVTAATEEDMVLRADCRGAGLGSVLLKAGIRCALESCCLRITLLTDGDNEAARCFYRRMGFPIPEWCPCVSCSPPGGRKSSLANPAILRDFPPVPEHSANRPQHEHSSRFLKHPARLGSLALPTLQSTIFC